MRKRIQMIAVCVVSCLGITGCSTEIKPDSKDAGTYSTQTPMSSLEYSLYMSKQITVFTNQLSSRMVIAKNWSTSTYENERDMAQESLEVMQDSLDEVIVTMPSTNAEDDRETTIEAMQTAVDHVQQYIDAIDSSKDVTAFADIFSNDFNALTGLANLYYE